MRSKLSTKVLFNALNLQGQFSGVHNYMFYLLKELDVITSGSEIHALLPNSKPGTYQFKNIHSIHTSIQNRLGRFFFENLSLKRYSKNNNFTLLHSPCYVQPILYNYPTVLTVHDIISLQHPSYCKNETVFHYSILLPKSIKQATRIIVPSETVKKDVLSKFNIPCDRIDVIYHGISPTYRKIRNRSKLNEVKRKLKLPDKFLLFVGNIEPKKNLKRILRAFKELKTHERITHHLIIAGQNGWKYREVYKMIDQLHLKNEVKFIGYVDQGDLPSLYSLADVFVFPSLYEGFGLPALEAMACETPTIISNFGALPEITGKHCIQVDPWSVEDIARGIMILLSNQELDKLAEAKKWTKKFSWNLAAQQTLKVYEEVLKLQKT